MGEQLAERWQRFAALDAPVITVYGSYDTAKSSLLRRILIELGQAVPSWLTISARHETFEVSEIRVAGCVLRDTPGFVVEGADARAELNTELASEAIGLTDVAVITVPPQLVTAEYPVLRRLVEQDWTPGSLWFVISRFDEAGVDPDDDLDGYRELAQRKTVELRTALNLADAVPVHVVCPDFAQMAGAERNPDPDIWDQSREWDGIADVVAAVVAVGSQDGVGRRDAAEQRYWRNAVEQALVQLPDELEKLSHSAVVSDEGAEHRESWLAQLDTVIRAAEADLRGRVVAAVSSALDSPDPAFGFAATLKNSVGAWHSAAERDVDKLLRSVGETMTIDRARPDWKQFDDLAARLRRGPKDPGAESGESFVYAPIVGAVGEAILEALWHFQDSTGLKKSGLKGSAQSDSRMAAAAAGIGLASQLATIAEGFLKSRRESKQERLDLQAALEVVGDDAIALGLDSLHVLIDDARQRIIDATADQVELRNSLHQMVGELRSLIDSGEALVS